MALLPLALIFVVSFKSTYCFSLRDYLFQRPKETKTNVNALDIEFSNNNHDYIVTVNGDNWLYSAPSEFRNNAKWANPQINSTVIANGSDPFGQYSEFVLKYIDQNDNNARFDTAFRAYAANKNIIIFSQLFPNDIEKTSVNNYDSVISSFPSFKLFNKSSTSNYIPLGYVHWSGIMAGGYPQYGQFKYESSNSLKGGISNSGPIALFDANLTNSIVISSLTYSMTANDETINKTDNAYDGTYKILRYGIQGGVEKINGGFKISFIMVLGPNGDGINNAMRFWGDSYLKYFNKPRQAHLRDYTLQHLGYGTDNGAYYFYYTIPNKNYADTLISIKKNHDAVGISSKWVQLDQWYYNQTWPNHDCHETNCHDYNFTANITLFPDGIMPVYKQTGWYFLAQTDPWSYDNVYGRNLGFEFVYNQNQWAAVPSSDRFYDYLFSINNKETWGLVAFERDWLSYITDNFNIIKNNTEFGRNWIFWMGEGAEKHNLTGFQLCMSYPRHILTSVESGSNAFTQARVSGDYHPGSGQWRIGQTSIFVSALDIAPSKDTWWSNNTLQTTGMRGRCSNGCSEPYNRLQAVIVALSNGPNYSSDRIGFENATLIMMCCNSNGLLLRPDVSATMMDNALLAKAKFGNNNMVNGELYSSMSYINNEYLYYYIFAAIISNDDYKLYPKQLSFYSNQTLLTDNYFVYESNTTNQIIEFNENKPLNINQCGQYDFQLYTIIPINKGYNVDQWYLMGELNKWIKVSNQRFDKITLYNNGSISVDIQGVQNENVTIGFVNAKYKQQKVIICNIEDASGKATVTVP